MDAPWPVGRQSVAAQVVMGLTIMAVGILFVLGNLGLLGAGGRWPTTWPFLLIIGIGMSRFVTPRPDGSRRGGVMVLVGIWLLLNQLDVWEARVSWPLFLVAVGIAMAWRAIASPRRIEGSSR